MIVWMGYDVLNDFIDLCIVILMLVWIGGVVLVEDVNGLWVMYFGVG